MKNVKKLLAMLLVLAMVFCMAGCGGGGGNANVTGQLMMSAARAKDIDTFQRLGANAADTYATPGMPELPAMPGKFLSEDGLLRTSSTCNHDADESHNVLIVFDQLFGGGQGVSGLKTYDGVTVVYPNN